MGLFSNKKKTSDLESDLARIRSKREYEERQRSLKDSIKRERSRVKKARGPSSLSKLGSLISSKNKRSFPNNRFSKKKRSFSGKKKSKKSIKSFRKRKIR